MADLLDILTLAEAKTALNLAGTTVHDAELPAWITAASRRLDRAVGPVIRRTVTAELHDGGGHEVRTALWPVASFTTVKEYANTTATTLTAETNTTKPADAYLAEPYGSDPTLFSGALRRRGTGSDRRFATGARNVEVTYVAGRYADTASVDEIFKTGARLVLQNFWNSQRPNIAQVGEFEIPTGNWPRFSIPNAVRELLYAHWQEGLAVA